MAVNDPIDMLVGVILTKAGRIERAVNRLMLWFWARSESGVFGWIGDRFDDLQCWLARRRGKRYMRRRYGNGTDRTS